MFGFFKTNKKELQFKGFKVCKNSDRNKKYGIAANSLKMLQDKVSKKFNLENEKFSIYYDHAIVFNDDFYETIPNQSIIVIVEIGEEYKTDYDVIIDVFRKTNQNMFHARDLIRNFVINNQHQDIIKALLQVHSEIDEKTKFSLKAQDPEWFANIDDKKSTTKEKVMRTKAKDRIKGYFYKTKDELTKSTIYKCNIKGKKIIDNLLDDFFLFLNGVEYFECIFDRSHEPRLLVEKVSDEIDARAFVKRRKIDETTKTKIKESNLFEKYLVTLCDDIGYFNCHGAYDEKNCTYEHQINPYTSKETLILFQIFNLDHQIEISRSIFPSIIRNVEKLCDGNNVMLCETHQKPCIELSTISYFLEIFSIKNLKLVHIICHDKGTHKLETSGRLLCNECKELKIYKKMKLKIS